MNYLYLFLGITMWVITVAFSSNALISYENTKQAKVLKSFVEKSTESVLGTKATTFDAQKIFTKVGQVTTKEATKETVSQPQVITPTVVTPAVVAAPPVVQQPIRLHRDQDDDD
jgi:hypothetical protein